MRRILEKPLKFELPRFVWTVQKAPLAYLKGFSLETIVTAVMFSMVGYFNGHGQTLWVMIQGLVQTLLVYIMSIQPDASLTQIGFAAPAATICGIVLNVLFYVRQRRRENCRLG